MEGSTAELCRNRLVVEIWWRRMAECRKDEIYIQKVKPWVLRQERKCMHTQPSATIRHHMHIQTQHRHRGFKWARKQYGEYIHMSNQSRWMAPTSLEQGRRVVLKEKREGEAVVCSAWIDASVITVSVCSPLPILKKRKATLAFRANQTRLSFLFSFRHPKGELTRQRRVW